DAGSKENMVGRFARNTKRDQLLDECGIRRVAIDGAIKVCTFGSYIREIEHVVSGQLPLNAEVPVVARLVAEMCVEEGWRKLRAVGNQWGRNCIWRNVDEWRTEWREKCAIKEISGRIEWVSEIVLLERRIAFSIGEEIDRKR